MAARKPTLLKKGMKGSEVKALQKLLNDLKAKPKLKVDGSFTSETADALRFFQKKAGLKQSGETDKKTVDALNGGGSGKPAKNQNEKFLKGFDPAYYKNMAKHAADARKNWAERDEDMRAQLATMSDRKQASALEKRWDKLLKALEDTQAGRVAASDEVLALWASNSADIEAGASGSERAVAKIEAAEKRQAELRQRQVANQKDAEALIAEIGKASGGAEAKNPNAKFLKTFDPAYHRDMPKHAADARKNWAERDKDMRAELASIGDRKRASALASRWEALLKALEDTQAGRVAASKTALDLWEANRTAIEAGASGSERAVAKIEAAEKRQAELRQRQVANQKNAEALIAEIGQAGAAAASTRKKTEAFLKDFDNKKYEGYQKTFDTNWSENRKNHRAYLDRLDDVGKSDPDTAKALRIEIERAWRDMYANAFERKDICLEIRDLWVDNRDAIRAADPAAEKVIGEIEGRIAREQALRTKLLGDDRDYTQIVDRIGVAEAAAAR